MTTYSRLLTPVGELILTASDAALTGVYFPTSRRGSPPTHHAQWIESKGEGAAVLDRCFLCFFHSSDNFRLIWCS